jgi:hypothetical protein
VIFSALVIGFVAFLAFQWLIGTGYSEAEARNGTLLLMVLFGTVIAQLVHIGAMYSPWLSNVLKIQPVSLQLWSELLLMATRCWW